VTGPDNVPFVGIVSRKKVSALVSASPPVGVTFAVTSSDVLTVRLLATGGVLMLVGEFQSVPYVVHSQPSFQPSLSQSDGQMASVVLVTMLFVAPSQSFTMKDTRLVVPTCPTVGVHASVTVVLLSVVHNAPAGPWI